MPIWGWRIALPENPSCRLRARRRRGNCVIESATGRSFISTSPRPAGDGKSGKGVPNSRVVASDLSSSRREPKSPRFVKRRFHPRHRPISTRDEGCPKNNRGRSRRCFRLHQSMRYTIAVLRGDNDQMERAATLAKGKGERNTSSLTRKPWLWLGPAAWKPPGDHRTAPWSWLCKRGNV